MSQQDLEQSATLNKLSTMEQLEIKVEPETHNDDTPHVHNMQQDTTTSVQSGSCGSSGRGRGGRGRRGQAEKTPAASPRAAGVRVRGGRARGAGVTVADSVARGASAQRRRLHALDDLTTGMVEDLPRSTPMEAPLHPKRRRSTFVFKDCVYGTGSSASESPRTQPGSYSVPPSAEFVDCGTPTPSSTTRPWPSRRSLRDLEVDSRGKNGSEKDDDSKGSEDDDEPPHLVPRSLRVYLSANEDTPEECEAAGSNCPVENEGVIAGPTALFDFEWKSFPSTPISPRERRETFRGRFGPMINPTSNPYDAFVKIWDRLIMEHIAHETNVYAQNYAETLLKRGQMGPSSRITKWRDTDADELYTYFALVIAMGVLVKSKLENYWTNDNTVFSTPGFSTKMTLKRFQILSRCLNFNDDSSFSPKIDSSQAKTLKIQPIVDHLNLKFSTLYGLSQNIALDDSLTLGKAWLDTKQRIPNKAATDIKTHEVCDSRTGYLWRFEVHTGGETHAEQPLITGTIPNLVLRLLRGLENRGHTVWMDDFYNSPALARVLKTLGYDCVGTLRTNRQFVPQHITDLFKSDMRVGQVFGCTSGDVDLMVWRGKNRAAMISTYHGNAVSDNKPALICDYNVCMGGVDKKDQIVAMYPMERIRTQIWYKKFFRRLLNVSIFNAYIIHKHFQPTTQHREFRMTLVTQILQQHQQRSELSAVPSATGVPKFSAEVIAHFPTSLPALPTGDRKQRRQCVVCKQRTHIMCNACNVALCFTASSSSTSSCYVQHHT